MNAMRTAGIAIIPAGGKATRIGGIPKMLLPIPQGALIEVLRERIRRATPRQIGIAVTVHTHMWIAHLADADTFVYSEHTGTMAGDVLKGQRFFRGNETALFGMADTYIEDEDTFVKLRDAIDEGADVAVGVFRARPGQHREGGMVLMTALGHVLNVVDKPETSDYRYIWGALAWGPSFWQHIDPTDPHVGYALPRAIAAGLDVRGIICDGGFWDCGTPDRYFDLIVHLRAERMFAA